MENETSAVIILFIGLAVAAVVHFITSSVSKSSNEHKREEMDTSEQTKVLVSKIERIPTSKTIVSLGVWEGVKFGIGLSIGFFIMSAFFGLVFVAAFVKIIEVLFKSSMPFYG